MGVWGGVVRYLNRGSIDGTEGEGMGAQRSQGSPSAGGDGLEPALMAFG